MSKANVRTIAKRVLLLSALTGIAIAGITCSAQADESSPAPATAAPPVPNKLQSATGKASPATKFNNNGDEVLQEIFALTTKPQNRENMDRVFALEKEGQALLDKNDAAKALPKFQDMYSLCKELKYGDGEGRALDRMALVYLIKGEKSRAKSLAENAMEVLSTSQDKKSAGRARLTAAQVYLALDNPLWALQELDQAMKDFTAGGMSDSEESARTMTFAATLALKVNSPLEAVKFYRGAAIHYGQCGNKNKEVLLRNTCVSLLLELGLTTAALEEAKSCVQTARTTKDPALMAAALIELASAHYNLCEYGSAKAALDEIYALKLQGQPPAAMALVDQVNGLTLAGLGDMGKARTYLEKSWSIYKHGGLPHLRAIAANALGVVYSHAGKHQQAIESLRLAQDAQSVVSPKNPRFELVISQNLGSALARSGESRQARQQLENALREMTKMEKHDEQLLGELYASLGEICWQLKEIGQADAYLRKSLEVASKINDDGTLWRSYTNLARLQLAMGQPAQESLTSAASHFRSPQAGSFPSAERFQFQTTREDLASDLIAMLISQQLSEQALITAEQLKEESFIVEWQKQGGDVKTRDREMYNDLVLERAHLHAYEQQTSPDKLLKNWQDWMRRLQLLSAENPELARLVSPVPLNLQSLVDRLHETQTSLVDYLVCPRQSFVFAIDKGGRLAAQRIEIGKDQLQAQVSTVLGAAQKSGPEARATEKRMLQAIFAEILPEQVVKMLPANPEQAVVFLPDGALFNLPFAALVDAQGRYLIETHTLTTAPGLVSVLDGGPKFGGDQSLVMTASAPADQHEENQITSLFEPDQIVKVGRNADLNQFAEEARNKSSIHFTSPLTIAEGSFLKFALPFASHQDGNPVTPNSLFKLSLPSDLAVWSATTVNAKESGSTKVFARGLAYAGVRNVLISLWTNPESDRTGELVEFYKGRKEGLSQAQSLRKAQLLAISKDPSVRAWAAFQLVGPGR